MDDATRLYEIEQELDKTSAWELPPYRATRAKLNRERVRILCKMGGHDPLAAVDRLDPGQVKFQDLRTPQRNEYRMQRQVRAILDTLNAESDAAWLRYKKSRDWS